MPGSSERLLLCTAAAENDTSYFNVQYNPAMYEPQLTQPMCYFLAFMIMSKKELDTKSSFMSTVNYREVSAQRLFKKHRSWLDSRYTSS
jgi:hypothetical protein